MRRSAVCVVLLLAGWAASADWGERLARLEPRDPMAYFELAEEVADVAADDGERELARRLFALAGVLDPQRLSRSACLALADLEEEDHARRRFLALASLLNVGAAVAYGPDPEQIDRVAALAVSEALSHYRRGMGDKALAALSRSGATPLLERYGHAVRGGAARFLADCELYRGQRRPYVSDHDLVRQLHLERALLAGDDRSWAGELLLTAGRPLVEVDPTRLEETLGVDPTRAWWRNGRWVRRP